MRTLPFYMSPVHVCPYLPGHKAVSLFASPAAHLDNRIYSRLIDQGFRRSGQHVYRPYCPDCDACIPARIPVHAFAPGRGELRVERRNADIEVRRLPPRYDEEHFQLYCRYLRCRHPDSSMNDPNPERYLEFLTSTWSATYFYELWTDRLLGVAIVDHVDNGLSAVYTFFDPDSAARSLGTYAVLWQIREAERLRLPYVYLGYWIRECRKMSYKGRYRPLEIFRNGRWLRADVSDADADDRPLGTTACGH